AYGSVETAVEAMREGASDYLAKPLSPDALLVVVERALQRRRLRAEAGRLRSRLAQRPRLRNVVGASGAIQAGIATVLQVARSRAPVLITGESGTGKDLIAAAIHAHGPRARGPFVKLHSAALAENGEGLLQKAHGGTLYLDEVAEIPLAAQLRLLRFLQTHEAARPEFPGVDARIVAATQRDLVQRVKEGAFREDLFYRLNVVSIELPPLRARPRDIPLLASHFLARFAEL